MIATKRSGTHCACCSDWKGKESLAEPSRIEDVIHLRCLQPHLSLVLPPKTWLRSSYKDKDRDSVKKDETWACPACHKHGACLTDSEKESRHHFAENEELKVVTWDPTWEPEEMATHAALFAIKRVPDEQRPWPKSLLSQQTPA